MRDIKFRGQIQGSKEWVYGDLVINKPSQTYRIFTDFSNIKHGNHTEDSLHVCGGKLQLINYKTLGQFIGFKDKNGKEIYDNDILEVKNYEFRMKWNEGFRVDKIDLRFIIKRGLMKMEYELLEPVLLRGLIRISLDVIFNLKLASGERMYIDDYRKKLEIIGNIHEDNNLISH